MVIVMAKKSIDRELRVLQRFVEVYCRNHHGGDDNRLPCADCCDLIAYARKRLERCPYDPKPKCKACETHCYEPAHRTQVRQIMRYSGMYFVKRGRLDWLVRYFLMS